ncbi:MAG TPA: glycosyltransferase family 4 protein [Conexibacter sp.]|jgi:glycosyltransferase involved in cell wall biosynthesis
MRIAVIEPAPFGGLLHYATQLADALAERGDEVDLLVPEANELSGTPGAARRLEVLPAGQTAARAGAGRLAVMARRARTALWWLATWRRMIGTVRSGRYDAVIFNGSFDLWLNMLGGLALTRLASGATTAHVCHNARPFNRWSGEELYLSSSRTLKLLGVVYGSFDVIFVHGRRSRDEFEEGWPQLRATIIPHGDEGIFAAEPPAPSEEPRVLFFGDWRKVKGLDVLTDAFDLLLERMPEARLTIAGTPAPEEDGNERVLRWASERPEQVETIARYVPIPEVRAVFARSRVVALPYLVGFQSGVLHLAMTMSRAVVASDVGDLGSVVVAGETGLIVRPGDAVGLADGLRELLADPEKAAQFGAAGHARARAVTSWSTVAERVEDELTSARRPADHAVSA